MSSTPTAEQIQLTTADELSQVLPTANSDAFIADLALDVAVWRAQVTSTSMRIATFDAREVGALRQTCYAAGLSPFTYLHNPDEGQYLKHTLGTTLHVPSITSVDVVRRITALHPDFVFPGIARASDTREPDERFADDLIQARAVVHQAMDWIGTLSDDAIIDAAAGIFAYPAAPHSHVPTIRQALDVFLLSTLSDLRVHVGQVRSTMDALPWLTTASFTPTDGWVMAQEPPAGFSTAQLVAETYPPLADCYVPAARNRAEIAAATRLAQLGIASASGKFTLPADPHDHFGIRAMAQQIGWVPSTTPERYMSGDREYLSYDRVTQDATQFLHDHYVRANYRVSSFDLR